jgi:PAS domain S-box-containing protein
LLEAGANEPALAKAAQSVQDGEAFLNRVRHLYDHPGESAHEELVLTDGRVIERFTSPFNAPDGESLGRIWFFRDISKRRKAEDQLRASEERFRMLIEDAPDAILLFDPERDRLISANRAAERLFGLPREEILKHGPQHFYAPEQPDARPVTQTYSEHNRQAAAGEEITFERSIRRPSGEVRMCRVTLVRLPAEAGLLRGSFVEITEQRAAEAELSRVLRSIVVRQEAERQRIARELHDTLGQYLAAMAMKLATFDQGLDAASPLKPGLHDLKGLTATIGNEVSRIAWELRPTALDDIGLEPAVQQLVDEWARRSGLQIDLHFALKNRRLPANVETALYRVLQEGMTNVVKHAKARKVGVILKASQGAAVMIIEDDGIGFELESLNRASHRLGLLGMRERLAAVRGSLEIETRPGEGTTLMIRVALDDPPA